MNDVLFSSKSEDWETPFDLFVELDREFHFTLDPCASPENAKCDRFYTIEDNGLTLPWDGVVFCNPPYGRQLYRWVRKASIECISNNSVIVMLLPARTDTSWFHDYIYLKHEIRFLRRRLRFNNASTDAPFPSMVVVFRPD